MKESTKRERLIKRNKIIRKKFHDLYEKKNLRSDKAIIKLHEEYPLLLPETISLIISQTGYYKDL